MWSSLRSSDVGMLPDRVFGQVFDGGLRVVRIRTDWAIFGPRDDPHCQVAAAGLKYRPFSGKKYWTSEGRFETIVMCRVAASGPVWRRQRTSRSTCPTSVAAARSSGSRKPNPPSMQRRHCGDESKLAVPRAFLQGVRREGIRSESSPTWILTGGRCSESVTGRSCFTPRSSPGCFLAIPSVWTRVE